MRVPPIATGVTMRAMAAIDRPLENEPNWPAAIDGGTARVVFLLDVASRFEARLIEGWMARQRPAGLPDAASETIRISSSRRRLRSVSTGALEACLAAGSDVLLAPLRVAWLPKRRGGKRAVRLSDILSFGDPRDPDPLRQRFVHAREIDRCRIVAGEPALASELRIRWQRAGGADVSLSTDLTNFVSRQAILALERGERALRGARYKVPRLVHEDILKSPAFRGALTTLARETGRDVPSLARESAADLREIAATHSPFVIDLVAQLTRALYSRGYDASLSYDEAQLERVKALGHQHPVVFLPSHKSNLDHLVLQYALHEHGHAPNHTAGGINMNFFPVGPLVRRSGTFFIRRTFRDDPVYKTVLQHYIDYLIEKRFSLEWYIEGGRSRSGKLLPPRFGLLARIVDAYRRGKADDVILIPVSIAYEQIQDVTDYAKEQRGVAKEHESFGWFVRFVRRLRRRYGSIDISFGEPIALSKALDTSSPRGGDETDEQLLAIQKLAFEVSVGINRATPITPTSLVTLALLGGGDRALSLGEARTALGHLLEFVERRDLPLTQTFDLRSDDGVRAALDSLSENDVVSCFQEGSEPVYRIGDDQHLAAAYYRNTIVHYFVNASIAELALLRAREIDVADPAAEFWDEAMRLRDLLKFEFFFEEKELFRGELRRELGFVDANWEGRLAGGREEIRALLATVRPFNAHRVLRPFLESYRLVADHLEARPADAEFDQGACVEACVGLGKQYLLQHRLHSSASVSHVLIKSALELAGNRDLLGPGDAVLSERRRALAVEVREALRRIDAIEALAASRRAGYID